MTRNLMTALFAGTLVVAACGIESEPAPPAQARTEAPDETAAAAERPAVGDIAPDFEMSDTEGRRVRLSDVVDEAPTVLVFYRGHW